MAGLHVMVSVFMFLSVSAVALFSFVAVASWADARRREREAFYRSDMLKRIAELPGGGNSALELYREEERTKQRRRLEGLKIGGLANVAIGLGLLIFLHALIREEAVYLVGLLPLFIGLALLTYAFVLAPPPDPHP